MIWVTLSLHSSPFYCSSKLRLSEKIWCTPVIDDLNSGHLFFERDYRYIIWSSFITPELLYGFVCILGVLPDSIFSLGWNCNVIAMRKIQYPSTVFLLHTTSSCFAHQSYCIGKQMRVIVHYHIFLWLLAERTVPNSTIIQFQQHSGSGVASCSALD